MQPTTFRNVLEFLRHEYAVNWQGLDFALYFLVLVVDYGLAKGIVFEELDGICSQVSEVVNDFDYAVECFNLHVIHFDSYLHLWISLDGRDVESWELLLQERELDD